MCHDPGDPRKFHGGDLIGLGQKVDYLRALGVTAVWITPVYKQVGSAKEVKDGTYGDCGYHGYWPDFKDPPDEALEPKLGTASDLSALIAALHARNMRFILDMVVNHAGYRARIIEQRRDWFHAPGTCHTLGDPVILCPLADLPDFKQELESGAVTTFLIKESTSWVRRFPIDGIRMDTARHVPDWFFRDFWLPAANRMRHGLFIIAEAFLEDSASQLKPFIVEQGFDSAFNFPLRRAFVDAFAKEGSVDLVANSIQDSVATLGLDRALMLVNLLDNHDVRRFVNEPGLSVSEDEIRRRYHLALVALFTLPGIPQLYYGDEIGLYGGNDPDNRRDMPDWAWSRSGRSQPHPGEALSPPQVTFSHVQKLIGIRKGNPALYRGYYAEMWRHHGDPQPNVYAFFRSDGRRRIITAINNRDLPSGVMRMPVHGNSGITAKDRAALADGTVLVDLLGSGAPSPLTLSDGHLPVNLPGKVAGVYRPRSGTSASAVTFRVKANTAFGEGLYVSGSIAELGSWELHQAVRMKPSDCAGTRCTWSITLRYLPHGQSLTFKFLRKSGAVTIWEGGTERAFTVPPAATATYDAQGWRD